MYHHFGGMKCIPFHGMSKDGGGMCFQNIDIWRSTVNTLHPHSHSLMFYAGWINVTSGGEGAVSPRTQTWRRTCVCAHVLPQMCCVLCVATLQWEGFTGHAPNTTWWVCVTNSFFDGISVWRNETDQIKRIVCWLMFSLLKPLLANIVSQGWLVVLLRWLYHAPEIF
jgi:hypothetical protein